mgnify:CR=1 FL=1
MATLAQINETLRDQTSSIEDGTKTTASLRDRFGEFLDRQKGSGDKREEEIETRRKERRQRVLASRPTSFTQGLTQGLGFGNGFGFGAIAQKILGAMGLAAGTIGLGAGKLLKFSPAIVALSDFGEKAIRGMVDYIDEEIEGVDFKEETKNRLTQGGQAAIASKLLGAKGLFGPAIAGIIGAYGETGIKKFNEFFGKKDGKYNIPLTDIEIDTETEAFKDALAISAALLAPSLIRMAGRLAWKGLRKVPLGRAATAVSVALSAMFGNKLSAGGTPVYDPNEAKNKGKGNVKFTKPVGGTSMAMNFKAGIKPPSTLSTQAANLAKAPVIAANSNSAPSKKFMNINSPLGGGKVPKSAAGLSAFMNSVSKFQKAMTSTLGVVSKFVPLIGVGLEAGLAQINPNYSPEMDPLSKASASIITSPIALIDSLQNLTAFANNMVNTGVNYGLDAAGIDYQFGMMKYSDMSGYIQREINKGYMSQLQNPPEIGFTPPNIGLAPEGFITDATFPNNPPVSFRGGDVSKTEQTIIQGVGQVISPADHFLVKID